MSAVAPGRDEELFVLEDGTDRYLLYAPLRRTVVALNGGAVGAVRRHLDRGGNGAIPGDAAVIDRLREVGLFDASVPAPPTTPPDYLFRPHEVTLFPTTRCNLRCVYCYANGGDRRQDMPWEIAQAAIDLVVANAVEVGREDIILGFHGGGEPTMAWSLLTRATLYAREKATAHGLQTKVHCATNGVLSPAQRRFMIEHFTGVNISLDGPAEWQDRQRPLVNGRGSFGRVMRTIGDFRQAKFPYGIRVTLTADGAPSLPGIVRFFHEHCPEIDQLHVEPVWYCGRCRTSGEHPPAEVDFSRWFLEAREIARELGFRLFYSGARLDAITNKFCAAPGEGFSVTPEGWATSCFEVSDPSDPRAELFHYGRFDRVAGRFVFDQGKLDRLRRLCVENIPHCRDCFCRWHCAGDCLAKSLPGDFTPQSHQGSPRCGLNRQLTLAELRDVAHRAAEPVASGRMDNG